MRFRLLLASLVLLALGLIPGDARTGARSAPMFFDLLQDQQIATAYTPDQISTAYDFAPLYDQNIDGSGQTIALMEIDRLSAADLNHFDTRYNLPAAHISQYYAGGQPFTVGSGGETTFDLEWLHALAPGAAIQVYYLDGTASMADGWRQMAAALHQVMANGASIVSISLGACRAGRGSMVVHQALAGLFHQDVSVFASSGDDGDHPGPVKDCGAALGVSYPGGDPFAASVGGTSLTLHDDSTIALETAWYLSGGGHLSVFARRPWEHAPTTPSGVQRWAPDVAFLGDPHTGVSYLRNGKWRQAGGTSLGAPAWAAAWALIRQEARSNGKVAPPAVKALYTIANSPAYSSAFHDITTGSNGIYRAGIGWDPVTGWGTPNVAALADSVGAISATR